jgi:hypothetical protein
VSYITLNVDAGVRNINYPMWVGDGHVGTISVPVNTPVNVYARGDLGGIQGPRRDLLGKTDEVGYVV